jgi:hypothetical protein
MIQSRHGVGTETDLDSPSDILVRNRLLESAFRQSQDLTEDAVCARFIVELERRGVDELERDGVWATFGQDVDGAGADVRGLAGCTLYEPGDAVELVGAGAGCDGGGVEHEAEEGGLACAPTSGEEGVATPSLAY